jgi:hypothetical protein
MEKEEKIIFRVDKPLKMLMTDYMKKMGIENISEFMRNIIIMHLMGTMLGYFRNMSKEQIMNEFLKKYGDDDGQKDLKTEEKAQS